MTRGSKRIYELINDALKHGLAQPHPDFINEDSIVVDDVVFATDGVVSTITLTNQREGVQLDVYGLTANGSCGWICDGPWVRVVEDLIDELEIQIAEADSKLQAKQEEEKRWQQLEQDVSRNYFAEQMYRKYYRREIG